MKNVKKIVSYLILAVVVPTVVIAGAVIFDGKKYAWISACVLLLLLFAFLLRFERKPSDTKNLIMMAVMTAIAVLGRVMCASLPGVNPISAFVIITAMCLGGEAGFAVGALTALISNFYFGHGAWTPFQMFAWGIVGLVAGVLAPLFKRHRVFLIIYGAMAGCLYSFLLDIWTVLWIDGYFNISRYVAAILSSAYFTAVYAVSNVVFLLLLAPPTERILERVKVKYGISN